MIRGSFEMMKTVNKSLVLKRIRHHEPISRAQIAKDIKLTPPTVSSIVKELLDEGLVKESALGVSKGGRKPTMLMMNSTRYYVVGVDVGSNTINCIISDLSGKVIKQASNNLFSPISKEQFLSILKNVIHHTISLIKEQEKIIGIGVAMHGVVEVESGVSLFAPNLKLENIPIKQELEDTFDYVVRVENDVRAMALGELWFGNHGLTENMMAVNIGSGVGAGVLIDGKLHHGANHLAGEIGHMTIDMEGLICECGNRGCFQSIVSGKGIVNRSNQLNIRQVQTGEEVYQLALEGHQEFIEVLEETGKVIGIGLTNLIHILNPDLIVLGGGVIKSEQFMLKIINQEINNRALTETSKETKVKISNLKEYATLLGAVSLLLEELFNPV